MKVVQRLRSGAVSAAWISWWNGADEQRRLKRVAAKVVARWQNAALCGAMLTWRGHADEQQRLTRTATKVVQRLRSGAVSAAWTSWLECADEQRRLKRVASKVVARWRNAVLCTALLTWRGRAGEQQRLACKQSERRLRGILHGWALLFLSRTRVYRTGILILRKRTQRSARHAFGQWAHIFRIRSKGLALQVLRMKHFRSTLFRAWSDTLNKLRKERAIICAFLDLLSKGNKMDSCYAVISSWKNIKKTESILISESPKADVKGIHTSPGRHQTSTSSPIALERELSNQPRNKPTKDVHHGNGEDDYTRASELQQKPSQKRGTLSQRPDTAANQEIADHAEQKRVAGKIESAAATNAKIEPKQQLTSESPMNLARSPPHPKGTTQGQVLQPPSLSAPQLVSRSSHLLTIKWNPWTIFDAGVVPDSSAIEYGMEWREGSGASAGPWNSVPAVLKACEATKRSLKPSTPYSFRIRARLVLLHAMRAEHSFRSHVFCRAGERSLDPVRSGDHHHHQGHRLTDGRGHPPVGAGACGEQG
jgi:hypothetical protein